MVGNSPANAGDMDLIPGWGGFHMLRATKFMQHNYRACALEPMLLNKKPAYHNQRVALARH